jgi:alpha-L-rhamnosidase
MPEALRGQSAPLFRREFQVEGVVSSARLEICGLGFYEAWINGRRVGDQVLDTAQTDYEVRCLYAAHDVTDHVLSGANAIGVMLGDGWFNQNRVWNDDKGLSYGTPRLLARLRIRLASGACLEIRTDETWQCRAGPVLASNLYAGERYDARAEAPGWNRAGLPRQGWSPVECVSGPGGRLESQRIPPIRAIEELRPRAISEPRPGCHVVDMGQNFSGWARIQVRAPAGTEVRLRFAEAVSPDGMIDTASTGVFATHVEQTDTYICKGGGVEVWEPRFTYHGYRYVEVAGWPGTPAPADITGVVVHTALPEAGRFECSDARLNQLHRMALWTHRSNIHGIPEDCPARERCGWLGDAHLVCEYSFFNFQGMSFWEKYLDDIESSRQLTGGLPGCIAPGKRNWSPATPDWMAALVLIPWRLHVHYGTRAVLERHFDGMRAVLEHFRSQSKEWILSGGLGDWFDPGTSAEPTYTPEALTTTVWFHECARIMARTAEALGRAEEAARYDSWLEPIRRAFLARFYDPGRHTFGSQTANAMALHFGLAPSGDTAQVVGSLVCDIRETHGLHHTTGIMGVRYLFEALTRHGEGTTALALMRQDTPPSFGDLILRGATTLWEYWGEPEVEKAHGPRSLNHPMMGGFDNWFYNTLAGIRPDEHQPGFRHFFLEPHPIPGLSFVRVHHDSPRGRIVSDWRMEKGRFMWSVAVPPNATATAILPYTREVRTLASGTHQLADVQTR